MAERHPPVHPPHRAVHRGRSVADLMKEQPEGQRIRLGAVTFRLNPGQYEQTTDRAVVVVQQASGGYGRYDYGPKPRTYTLDGTSGLDGLGGPAGIEKLRQFEPQPGRPDTLWPFEFPAEFKGRRYVKVNEFKLSRQANSPYFHDFHLVLEEYPKNALNGATKIGGTVMSTPLPVGG